MPDPGTPAVRANAGTQRRRAPAWARCIDRPPPPGAREPFGYNRGFFAAATTCGGDLPRGSLPMKLALAALAALTLCACASTSTSTTGDAPSRSTYEEKEYRTGSRIPVRDSTSASPAKTLDPSALSTTAPPRVN
jgi:hypothetical protein